MLPRSKFKSLIMINWNGFFARKYDLDNLVTTLSGGNGAGKSTTMAAFITALIPDLSLLHFRNTTEAGSTSSSRDRGLHGKLKSGVCYAALECVNSRGEVMIFGVRLQQISGRDKKVDLKLFSLQGLDGSENAINLFFEQVGDKAKILNLADLKAKYNDKAKDRTSNISFKQYASLGDYHGQMFDYGFLPKRLRTPQDRSRFYRLIEASLYGGISSTITKSLREYLLPENQSVKRAFQDMEHAIRENRQTLDQIAKTQSDRDLFVNLVKTATDYVASDYILRHNHRVSQIKEALSARQDLGSLQRKLTSLKHELAGFTQREEQLKEHLQELERQHEEASDYYNLLVSAQRLQEQYDQQKAQVDQYQEDCELKQVIVEETTAQKLDLEEQLQAQEAKIDSLRRQLADTQQALNEQEVRKVQYKQAVAKLAELSKLVGKDLTLAQVEQTEAKVQQELPAQQQAYYRLHNALQLSQSSQAEYEQAFAALTSITGNANLNPELAYSQAQSLVRGFVLKRSLVERQEVLEREYHQLKARRDASRNSSNQINQLQQQLGESFASREELLAASELNQAQFNELNSRKYELNERLAAYSTEMSLKSNEYQRLQAQTVPYLRAQEELERLQQRLNLALNSSEQAREQLTKYLQLSNQQGLELQNLRSQKEQLEDKIHELDRQGLGIDQQLQYLAQDLGGVLLSEIYDDVDINGASFYSALYGPARDAIVLPSLVGIEEKLKALTDLPADLYLIEGDFKDFDENKFEYEMLREDAVMVRLNDHQIRYSTLQEATAFGKAAREKYLEDTRDKLKDVLFKINELEEGYFTNKSLADALTNFIAQFADVAFIANPEQQAKALEQELGAKQREINGLRQEVERCQQQATEANEKATLLNRLLAVYREDLTDNLEEDYQRVSGELSQAKEASHYLHRFSKEIAVLEQSYSKLQYAGISDQDLEQQVAQAKQVFEASQQLELLCREVLSRKDYFEYKDLGDLEGDELADQLREQLASLETEYKVSKDQLKLVSQRFEEERAELLKLQANLASAQQNLEHLAASLREAGTSVTPEVVAKAKQQAAQLQEQSNALREKLTNERNQNKYNCEQELNLKEQVAASQRNYFLQRKAVISNKEHWKEAQDLVKEHKLAQRLLVPELRGLSDEELRSNSDRALGSLRSLVQDNEYLRDALKASENNRSPNKKIELFIAVYNHLRERIRQDVLSTDDPIEAIAQMSVQLDKLNNQLQAREKSLVISASDVSAILDKTIQREQNRIWQLNQGLQNMSFGQVKSVRLTATYRESHAQLLNALREGHKSHNDLFDNSEFSFTEALARLYQRVNVDYDIGQRNYQTVGEELLDYRNYIDLGIEVFRGSDGWLKAESGALSTGEAIGTGMSILLMVVQSWEEEARRMRAKDLLPCRLLFLDEAARLDAKSIATLFELCERQQMQLLIAAPENISPDNGTTYKLMRRVEGNKEYVHVVGLRGFGGLREANN